MRPFAFSQPLVMGRAIEILSGQPHAKVIAGGTSLIDLMQQGVEAPALLVDLNQLEELRQIDGLPQGGLRIGATVSNATLARDSRVLQDYPIVAQALLGGAPPQLRNAASAAGNLLQRTRCPYFRDPTLPCNRRQPGSGCGARNGWNRLAALFGTSESCVASYPSDLATALTALDAKICGVGPTGAFSMPITDLHRLPGSQPELEHNLPQGSLITSIDLEALPPGCVQGYDKATDSLSHGFALSSVAVVLRRANSRIDFVRIAVGGVATTPWRLPAVERYLLSQEIDSEVIEKAGQLSVESAQPLGQNDFKVVLLQRMVTRLLEKLWQVKP